MNASLYAYAETELTWGWRGPCPSPPPPPTFGKKPFSIQKFIRPPLTELPSSKCYHLLFVFYFVFFLLLLCPFLCLFNKSSLVLLIFISCFIRLAHVRVINDESNFYNPSHIVFYSFEYFTTFRTCAKLFFSTFLHLVRF